MAGGWAVAEVKLAECMSRIEGATALGLHGVCKLYHEEEWQHDLRSYGIFGILDDEEVDRLRPVKVKREPDSAGSPTTLAQVQELATSSSAQRNTSKRRKTELARASDGPGSPRDACQCSGACGSKACGTRRNSLVRQKLEVPCPNKATKLGCSYCSLCQCMANECMKPRYRGRWCKTHSKQYDDDGDTKSFSTPFVGKVAFPDTWPVELRLVAKFNYVLPLMIPMDFTVLIEWTPDQLSPSFLVAAFLAQSLKWPPAVSVFYEAVRKVVEPAMAGTQEIHGSTKCDDPAMAMLAIINPACFCEMTYGQLVQFCPDQRELTAALEGMLVGAVERLFNVNPLLIACWMCLFGGMRVPEDDGHGKKMKQVLAASSLLVMRAVE